MKKKNKVEKGVSIEALAKQLGMSPLEVLKKARERNMDLHFEKIGNVLEDSVIDSILTNEDPQSKQFRYAYPIRLKTKH